MKMMPKPSSVKDDLAFTEGSLVLYQADGQDFIGVITAFKKPKYSVFNMRGRDQLLAQNRLHLLPGKIPGSVSSNDERTAFLEKLYEAAESEAKELRLEELWEVAVDSTKDYYAKELTELFYSDNTLEHHLTLCLAIHQDPVYFKRKKDGYEPRPASTVEELKKAEAVKAEKLRIQEATASFFKKRFQEPELPFPDDVIDNVLLLERCAASALDGNAQKEASQLLELCKGIAPKNLAGAAPEQAYQLLEQLGHFDKHTNLALIKHNTPVSFSTASCEEAEALVIPNTIAECLPVDQEIRRDLTDLHTITIDDSSTRDMDDALSLELLTDGEVRLGVHISDVAYSIPIGSALDKAALRRGTSMYLPDRTLNMFPDALSEDKLSLVQEQVRPCITSLFTFDSQQRLMKTEIFPSLISVRERISYDEADDHLENGSHKLLDDLYTLTSGVEGHRLTNGAFQVGKRELRTEIAENGEVDLVEIYEDGPARKLIGETAILANSVAAEFMSENQIPALFRGQDAPDAEDPFAAVADVPEGPARDYALRGQLKRSTSSTSAIPHAGLGLSAYIQITSPIRRYIDLLHQRQLLSFFRTGSPCYSNEELEELSRSLEEPLTRSRQVTRESKRYWLFEYLRQKKRKETLQGTVVNTGTKNPLIHVYEIENIFPVRIKGKVSVGDSIPLRIATVNPRQDYLKLEPAN